MSVPSTNLHTGFAEPDATASTALGDFLRAVDRLPDVRGIQAAMRDAAPMETSSTLLDVGCGLGLETTRLAAIYPHLRVTGCDHNSEILALIEKEQSEPSPENLTWLSGDYHTAAIPESSQDIVRTERVLMYAPDLASAVARIKHLLRPGGTLVSFELDYGSMLLPQGDHDASVLEAITTVMRDSLPQPWAGRQLPWLTHKLGFDTIMSEPITFSVTSEMWSAIVGDTVKQAIVDGALPDAAAAWAADYDLRESTGLHAAFTGVLTVARA